MRFILIALLIAVSFAKLPTVTRGVYIILADNTAYVTNSQGQQVLSTGSWQPKIGNWVQQFNVVFFTFINTDMVIPPSFEYARLNTAWATGTKIIYAIGGQAYSSDNKWREVFGSIDAAKRLAAQVASWKCDGIDLDIEDPIGNDEIVAVNIVEFARELKRLRPDFIVSQPVYGYPQVYCESIMTVSSWDHTGTSKNLADSIGIMTYSGTSSLQYITNYDGTSCTQWWCALCSSAKAGNPCSAVPPNKILAGLGGDASSADVQTVCNHQQGGQKLGGYMVWYASADNGFQYGGGAGDARVHSANWNQCGNSADE